MFPVRYDVGIADGNAEPALGAELAESVGSGTRPEAELGWALAWGLWRMLGRRGESHSAFLKLKNVSNC